MATTFSLKTTNRSPKQPIKKLPASIELSDDATVDDAKMIIARQARVSDYNRIGLFDPATKKILKDRRARIKDQESVLSSGELLVKDLGLQMSWRLVFVVEYFGPILFHAAILATRPYLYADAESKPVTDVQWLVFWLFQAHFVKRELETLFVHKFSANTMPAFNIFRNSFFYWSTAGLLSAFCIYAPWSFAARHELEPLDWVGLGLFVYGEVCNAVVHLHLASLRKTGGTEKGIPSCIGSSLVTCPNYMFEVVAWIGVIIISREWAVVLFICIGIFYMKQWSRGKEMALRKAFPDKYKKKRYFMLPGLF